jgi:hypothetical protein
MTQPGPPAADSPPDAGPRAQEPPGGPAGGDAADGAPPDAQPEPADDHALGSGDAAGQATSRYGQGSLRNEYLREAERLAVEGDAVARDKNVFLIGGQRRARLRPLSRRHIDPVRMAFVAPDSLPDIHDAFAKSRAVILRGPAGCGKQALAIRMLIDLSPRQLFHLDRAVDLTRLAEWIETDLRGRDRIEHGAGFLLDQPLGFTDLYGSVLQGLEEALEQADARLVLTIDSGVQMPDRDLLDYVVDLAAAPSYFAIVASHLDFRLGHGMADPVITTAGVREEIEQQLAEGASCKLAAELAEAIAAEWDLADGEHQFDPGVIRTWRSRRGTENFDIWFAELGDTRARSFAVALAILNGLPYDVVSRGARALYRRFDQPAPPVLVPAGVVPESPQPFRVPRREWLHKLQAQIRETEVLGPYGPSPAEVVEYRDPAYATKVLERAWSDYEAQDVLLSWLGELAEDSSAQVRIFAGRALGLLAASSFDTLSTTVLVPWAAGANHDRREAVAYALRVLAADPRRRDNVTRLVSGWHASGKPEAQAMAARAYGVACGLFDPLAAFRALDHLTTVGDIRVAVAVGDSIADLLAAGSDDFVGLVLTSLAGAVREPDRTGSVQLIFLILADGLLDTVDSAGEMASPVSWPLLLRLTTRLAGVRPAIVTLWQRVLNEALFHEEAEQVMSRWAAAAESEPDVREAFLRLARAIASGDERTQMILRRYCARWASTDNFRPLPEVSAALQTILSTSTEAR